MALGKQSQQLVSALISFFEPERDHRGCCERSKTKIIALEFFVYQQYF